MILTHNKSSGTQRFVGDALLVLSKYGDLWKAKHQQWREEHQHKQKECV